MGIYGIAGLIILGVLIILTWRNHAPAIDCENGIHDYEGVYTEEHRPTALRTENCDGDEVRRVMTLKVYVHHVCRRCGKIIGSVPPGEPAPIRLSPGEQEAIRQIAKDPGLSEKECLQHIFKGMEKYTRQDK